MNMKCISPKLRSTYLLLIHFYAKHKNWCKMHFNVKLKHKVCFITIEMFEVQVKGVENFTSTSTFPCTSTDSII